MKLEETKLNVKDDFPYYICGSFITPSGIEIDYDFYKVDGINNQDYNKEHAKYKIPISHSPSEGELWEDNYNGAVYKYENNKWILFKEGNWIERKKQ